MDKLQPSWREPATSHREVARKPTLLRAEFGVLRLTWPCLVLDISPRGAGVRVQREHVLEVGTPSTLRIMEYGLIQSEVRHCEHAFVGVLFAHRGANDLEMIRWLASLHIT